MQIFQFFTKEVVDLLQNGAVGIIPTDTLYGLVCTLSSQSAVERIYDIKQRDHNKPVGTILVADSSQLDDIVNPRDLLAAHVYWPGPVSVVLEVGNRFSYAHRGKKGLPFRVPNQENLQNLLSQTGPLATTSANLAGELPATTAQEAMGIFRENVDFYVDGGDLSSNKASKIIEIKHGTVQIIRE